ncbi:MAG: SGNH/GDSL hydrolase family protein [Lachnospiraceae bacterium]|nr:SGNH/GDSL hydrolase family protein [Lachnospiraceae bacterium]
MKKSSYQAIIIFLMLCLLITGVIIAVLVTQSGERQNFHDGQIEAVDEQQSSEPEQTLPEPAPEPIPAPEPRFYIALGDSISEGYGVSETDRYPDLLFALLKEDDLVNKYKNLSITGFTTGMLLAQLENLSGEDLGALQNAHIISLNIGGNNILKPLINYLPDFQEIIDMIAEVGSIAGDAMGLAAKIDELNAELNSISNNFTISDLLRVGEFLQRATAIFNESIEMFGQMNELNINNPLAVLSGPLPPELEAKMEKGITDFTTEFAEIITLLNENAPNAVIIVNTLYNPIPEEVLGLKLELSGQAETYTRIINEIIFTRQYEENYLIADVYNTFANIAALSEVMNYHLDLAQMNLNFDIIHPNVSGHRKIAELNYEVLKY